MFWTIVVFNIWIEAIFAEPRMRQQHVATGVSLWKDANKTTKPR